LERSRDDESNGACRRAADTAFEAAFCGATRRARRGFVEVERGTGSGDRAATGLARRPLRLAAWHAGSATARVRRREAVAVSRSAEGRSRTGSGIVGFPTGARRWLRRGVAIRARGARI